MLEILKKKEVGAWYDLLLLLALLHNIVEVFSMIMEFRVASHFSSAFAYRFIQLPPPDNTNRQ